MTHADMIGNILAVYDASTAGQRERGHRWYVRINRAARLHADRLGLQAEHVAGVYAAWSINNGLRNNLRQASATLRGRQARGLKVSIRLAAACMSGQTLRVNDKDARKVLAFCANIAGDYSRVTVDRWALRVAYGIRTGGSTPKGDEYDAIERAYVEAAQARGIAPAMLQAATWCAVREGVA